jgi:NADH-quinone oxidoreductase subunit M
VQATTKFVIYTLVGSLLMLAAAVALGVLSTPSGGQISFNIADLAQHHLSSGSQEWIFLLFAAAFLVKMPAFPLHGWMPDAYRATPIPVLVLLSAVLSKVGAYGFLRIVLPLMPDASRHFQELMIVVAVVSILYGSILAFSQDEARLVVGYSSIAQLGFITLGIFSLDPKGAQGAVLQMVNHGLVTAALFLIIAVLAARAGGSELLSRMGGLAMRAPVLAALFLIAALATLAMPGSANFVGELYILFGIFSTKLAYGIVAAVGVALAAVYMIRMYQRAMHNRLGPGAESREISRVDFALVAPLIALVIALGVYPQFVLQRSEASTVSRVPSAANTVSINGHVILRNQGGWTSYAPLPSAPRPTP